MIKTVVVSPLFRPGLVYAQTMRLGEYVRCPGGPIDPYKDRAP